MRDKGKISMKKAEAGKPTPVSTASKKVSPKSGNRSADQILHLQGTIGNREVQRLIKSGTIQAKLTIGKPNDKYEQEADRVADKVMSMPEPGVQRQPEEEKEEIQTKPLAVQITSLVQRQVDEEEEPVQSKLLQRQENEEEEEVQTKLQHQTEEEEEEPVQAKQAHTQTPAVTSNIESDINSLKGGGQPLSASNRAFFEPRFGANFSQVRIHTDSKASEAAQSINAIAFTTGKDVVLGADQYSPETSSGKKLLAHELTHVVQQNSHNGPSGMIQKNPNVSQRMGMRVVRQADGSIEVTANRPCTGESGSCSTIIGMAYVTPGVTEDDLIKELVDCGAYKNEKHVREGFIQGTRIVVKGGKVLEISVRGKVYKAGGVQKPDFNYFLEEGSRIFSKADFGISSGEAKGEDAGDGYDSRYWKEEGARGTIRARIQAWDAVDKMVRNIGQEVPKAGGGKTKWSFDCFEAAQILRLYAIWRTTTRREFNRTYRPLKLGFFAGTKTGLGETFYSDGPGMPAYKYVGGEQSGGIRGGASKVILKKSINDLFNDAPVGSFVAFGSKDIQARCAVNSKLDICDFMIENTIKVGKDRFFAHPFGVVSSGTIFEKMAEAVGGTPGPEYYRKNIYVSKVMYPK